MRSETVLAGNDADPASTNSFGGYLGGGAEFNIYRKHIYLGVDIRYHLVFFPDEDAYDDQGPGTNSGDYFSTLLTLTFNF